jgi:cardiolipin synthase A/B
MEEHDTGEASREGAIGGSSRGNRATLFDDGAALFEEKAAAIRSARERVWIETFLFMPDQTGRAALQLAADAARRGCDVILLFDQAGSHVTNLGFFKPVEDAGGRVAIFNPLPPWRRYGRRLGSWLRHRDHRKIVIADGIGFCGGHNFTSSYMGPPPHSFYDMTLKLEGPCVRDLASVFLDSFQATTGESRPLPEPPAPLADGVGARVLALDTTRGLHQLVQAYCELLESAADEVLLILGYFVPDETLCAPLTAAAERGVKVSVLTAGATDFPFIRLAGQHTYDRLLAVGIRIYQLQDPQLHAKAIVVDGERCMVGSFDVNQFERRNAAEVAVILDDQALAGRIHQRFRSCLPRSEEITPEQRRKRSALGRAAEWLTYRVVR